MDNRPRNQAGYFQERSKKATRPERRRPRRRRKRNPWKTAWTILQYPVYILMAIATTGYLVGGSWIWYILLTK